MPDNSSADDDCLETGQAPTLIALQPDFLPNDWHGDKAPISMAIGAGQSHLIGKTLFETLGLTDA